MRMTMPRNPTPTPDAVFETVGMGMVEAAPVPVPIPVNPLYERQTTLNLHKPNVILIGAGGVGCWVALSLVLGGVDKLSIYDGDTLSTHNLNRFPLPITDVGKVKSLALANWLRTLRPEADIVARGRFEPEINPPNPDSGGAEEFWWVICATDSLKSRRMCHDYAESCGFRYLEVGADGERWTLSPTPPEFSTALEEEPGYTSIPVHVGPCMMAGAAAAYYVLHDCVPIVSHSAEWEKGPILKHYPNLGGIKFSAVTEVNFPTMMPCPVCHREMDPNDVVTIIKHIREESNLGLIEAKFMAERWIAEWLLARDEQAAQSANLEPENVGEDYDPENLEDDEAVVRGEEEHG